MPQSPASSPNKPAATMADIARACGVSKGTVSLALNRDAEDCPLRSTTRDRVLKAAKEMGYQINWRGRMLAGKRSQAVAMIYGRTAPYPQEFRRVSLLAEAFQKRQHDMMLVPAIGPFDDWSRRLADYRVDGCLVSYPAPKNLERLLQDTPMPVVLMNLDNDLDIPRILFDDYDGARQATRHLLELGHRKISYFIPGNVAKWRHYSSLQREAGFLKEMTSAGLASSGQVWVADHVEAAERFLQTDPADRPTAILGYAQDHSMALVRTLWEAGIRVPDDLSVAAFNDDTFGENMAPAMTSVALPWDQLAALAVEYLFQLFSKTGPQPPHRTVLPEKLIVRQSTARLDRH